MIQRFYFFGEFFCEKFAKKKFTNVYQKNLFKGKESRSGEGSNMTQTTIIRREIPLLIKELKIKSLIDAPCGDFFWMREVELPVERYIGVDIVKDIVENNQKKYGNQQRIFRELNIIEDVMPMTDMILCRDCLVHLSFRQGIQVINNFKKSGAKYLLTTTFVNRLSNHDLGKGFWRTINIERPPFNFPKPINIIDEKCTELNGEYTDKSLGLFLLKDIHIND
ncbi:hypothetical protein C6A37_00400 [Desulfobacteraceae bacterium SEEP-SAG9]|nr:hypothetical protein C6A37_00400 [Desulfobacteraceae bacterium SEEP-SAG9]